MILPDWVRQKENYTAEKDSDYFITKSLLGIVRMLRQLRFQSKINMRYISAEGAAILTVIIVILCACSHTSAFLISIAAFLLIIISMLEGNIILRLFKHSFLITVISSIFLLPAFYYYQNPMILLIPVKTFLTIMSISLLTTCFNWHRILDVMNKFHFPSIVVFIFDTTLRYIVLLGETSQQILSSLKIRSIGRNKQKSMALAGVMGVLFQKSRKMSEEMYQAMCCRCFTGSYSNGYKERLTYFDYLLFLIGFLYCWLFFVLERFSL